MRTDDVLKRMFNTLYDMATDASLLNPAESSEISQWLQRLQSLLSTLVVAWSSTPDHLARLETYYRTLANYTARLEVCILWKNK
jgi:DNA-binding transcriptional regulator YbjK